MSLEDDLEWLYESLDREEVYIGSDRRNAKGPFQAFVSQVQPGATKGRISVEKHTMFFVIDKASLDSEKIKFQIGLKVFRKDQVYEMTETTTGSWEFNDPFEIEVAIKTQRLSSETKRNSRTDPNET